MIEASARHFRSLVGDDGVRVITTSHPAYAPHPIPLVHVIPPDRESLIACVALAHRERIGLAIVGGNTCPRLPLPGRHQACLLSTELVDRVIEHAVDDLTLTAEAGAGFADLDARLKRQRQRLPFTASRPERNTLGGLIAAGHEGFHRKAFGQLRDQILGVEVVHGDGRVTRSGGRVVKNVTGYDLIKAYCGSRGALGIILSATVRLRGRPEAEAHLCFLFEDAMKAWNAAMLVRQQLPESHALHVLTPGRLAFQAAIQGTAAVVVTLEGSEEFVEAAGAATYAMVKGDLERRVCAETALPILKSQTLEESSHLELQFLTSDGGRVLEATRPFRNEETTLVLDVECGTAHLGFRGGWPFRNAEHEAEVLRSLAPLCPFIDSRTEPAIHHRRSRALPPEDPVAARVMHDLARALDPEGILNPGRHEVPR